MISFLPQPASSEIESENIFDNELMKFDKKLEKQFMEYEPESQDYYPNVGAALRFFNPFSAKEPNQIKYRLNLPICLKIFQTIEELDLATQLLT